LLFGDFLVLFSPPGVVEEPEVSLKVGQYFWGGLWLLFGDLLVLFSPPGVVAEPGVSRELNLMLATFLEGLRLQFWDFLVGGFTFKVSSNIFGAFCCCLGTF